MVVAMSWLRGGKLLKRNQTPDCSPATTTARSAQGRTAWLPASSPSFSSVTFPRPQCGPLCGATRSPVASSAVTLEVYTPDSGRGSLSCLHLEEGQTREKEEGRCLGLHLRQIPSSRCPVTASPLRRPATSPTQHVLKGAPDLTPICCPHGLHHDRCVLLLRPDPFKTSSALLCLTPRVQSFRES